MSEYENFVFYGKWRKLLEGFDEAKAKEILWQIMVFGTSGEVTSTDPMVQAIIYGAIECNMSKAKERYRASSRSKNNSERFSTEEIDELKSHGLTDQEVADNLGCSIKTVQRKKTVESGDDEI